VTACNAAALVLVGQTREPGERFVERQPLAVEGDAELGEELVEEAAPGARAGDALLGRDPLLGFREQVRLVAAVRAEDGGVLLERWVGEQPLGNVFVERAPLEVEEEELRLDLRVPLAHLLDERTARLIGAVRGLPETCVRLDTCRCGVDPLHLDYRFVELGRGELA
jgi:hypothetical protein